MIRMQSRPMTMLGWYHIFRAWKPLVIDPFNSISGGFAQMLIVDFNVSFNMTP
jgi:hypothetical protein